MVHSFEREKDVLASSEVPDTIYRVRAKADSRQ